MANATNLTILYNGKYCPDTNPTQAQLGTVAYRDLCYGDLSKTNWPHLEQFYMHSNNNLIGTLADIAAARIVYININYVPWRNGHNIWSETSNKISGDISVFADKYDMARLEVEFRSTIVGEVKSLKNLKKFFMLGALATGITGSKSDLYNNGANITYFHI